MRRRDQPIRAGLRPGTRLSPNLDHPDPNDMTSQRKNWGERGGGGGRSRFSYGDEGAEDLVRGEGDWNRKGVWGGDGSPGFDVTEAPLDSFLLLYVFWFRTTEQLSQSHMTGGVVTRHCVEGGFVSGWV